MVFQNFNLFGHRTVMDNIIEAPVHVKGEPVEQARARAMELLDLPRVVGTDDDGTEITVNPGAVR